MQSPYDSSVYTYRDWALEYASTEDCNSWNAEKLDEDDAQEVFRARDLFVSIVLKEDNNNQVPTRLRKVNADNDDFIMEPMFVLPPECLRSMARISSYIDKTLMPISISASFHDSKNLVFVLSQCVVCVQAGSTALYIPSSFMNKIKRDMSVRDIQCEFASGSGGVPFHRTVLALHGEESARQAFADSRKRKVTASHIPIGNDGYDKYAIVEAVLSVSIISRRSILDSRFGSDPVTFHGKRRIVVHTHAVYPLGCCNSVASVTDSDGNN